ncbi:MAG: LytR/AlgR family response regulator transcription factor [Gemmatimonadota bacterium]
MADRPFRAVVVDDEPGARADLCALLSDQRGVEVVGEAADVVEARRLIARERPDLVFLDIHLDRESGFELLEGEAQECHVVFVTAHAEHAVRAFEANALDYLLKPVIPSRLRTTLDRLRGGREGHREPARSLAYEDWLFLSVGRRRRFLRVNAISHILADGDYSVVHTRDG